jgi:hypothetical protein
VKRTDLRTAQALIQKGNESQFSLAIKLPIIDELVKQRDELILQMNQAKKAAIVEAGKPFMEQIVQIEEQLSSIMIMAGGAQADE